MSAAGVSNAPPGILSTLSRELSSPELPVEFLGLEESHTEWQLRLALLANLRYLFLERSDPVQERECRSHDVQPRW